MNEDELRAALRLGEGDDVPAADDVVSAVRGRRTQRRVRALSVAAAVVVVAGAAVGGAVLASGSSGNGQQAGAPTSSVAPSVGTSPQTVRPQQSCPSTDPSSASPAVPSAGTATGGPMFGSPVRSLVVCLYSTAGATASAPQALLLTGDDATALARSIEQASTTRLAIMCPMIRTSDRRTLAIVGTSTSGTVLPTVTTDISTPNCNHAITNGTAVRWNWQPPASLTALINGTRTSGGGADGGTSGAPGSAPAGSTSGSGGSTGSSGVVRLPVVRPSGVDGGPAR